MGAKDRADQRAAPAKGNPDHRFNRITWAEFARVDDTHKRHVKRTREPRHHGRQHKDK